MKNSDLINLDQLRTYFTQKKLDLDDKSLEELVKTFDAAVESKIRQTRNKHRLVRIDESKTRVAAAEVLSENEIARLPSWVSSHLEDAFIVGSSRQVIQVPDGRKYHLGNPLNDLSGGEWTFFLNSVISTRYPTAGPESFAHAIRKVHPSPKPPQLMRQIIEFFTKEGETVLDYFMGVGGTLLGASLSGRRAIGIDLSEEFIDTYKRANEELGLIEQATFRADSIKLLEDPESVERLLGGKDVSLIAIDPPYGDMMNREKTGEAAKEGRSTAPTPFTALSEDLGNLSIEEFFPVFTNSVANAIRYLKTKGHVVVFIKDLQPNGVETNLLHARVIEDLNSLESLQYLGTKIWADNSVNLYPYGYPYSYVANQIHQYIMIFRKTG